MNQFDQQWRKLTAWARQAPDNRDASMPHGFSTRVVARLAIGGSGYWSLLERFALRGILAAGVCCGAAVAFSFSGHPTDVSLDTLLEDTVSMVVADLS